MLQQQRSPQSYVRRPSQCSYGKLLQCNRMTEDLSVRNQTPQVIAFHRGRGNSFILSLQVKWLNSLSLLRTTATYKQYLGPFNTYLQHHELILSPMESAICAMSQICHKDFLDVRHFGNSKFYRECQFP